MERWTRSPITLLHPFSIFLLSSILHRNRSTPAIFLNYTDQRSEKPAFWKLLKTCRTLPKFGSVGVNNISFYGFDDYGYILESMENEFEKPNPVIVITRLIDGGDGTYVSLCNDIYSSLRAKSMNATWQRCYLHGKKARDFGETCVRKLVR